MDILELSKLIQKQGETWEQHKATNDEILKAKADGKAVGLLEEKLAKIAADMDKFAEAKTALESEILGMKRNPIADKGDASVAAEIKSFNDQVRAEYQSRGKPIPAEFDADGYKHYKNAFFKMAKGANVNMLDGMEQKALIAGSDPDGGYMLPASTVGAMVAKLYEQSVMRQICNVQTIGTEKLEGIVDNDEADAGWVSELGSRTDTGTPQIGKYEIEAHEMYAMPKISQKLIDDSQMNVEAWLAAKVADKFARVEGDAFVNGNGVGKPRGLFTYTTAATGDDSRAWGQFEHVKTGANGAFHTTKADPIIDLIGAFKSQYLAGASFLMRREVRTALRKLKEATSDRYLWEPSMQIGLPETLMGYRVIIDQYLPAIATGSLSLAFGDFRQAFTIVDRIGVRTLRDPFTAKPYIVYYSTKRSGSGATNYESVKFLQFSA